MTGTGFFEQKSFRPSGLGVVVALHAGALALVLTMKPIIYERPDRSPTTIFQVPIDPDPPEIIPEPVEPQPTQLSQLDTVPPIIERPRIGPDVLDLTPVPPPPIPGPVGTGTVGTAGTATIVPPPMRIEAEFDPRFADALQPPYPTAEQRAQRDGTVRLRVTIGADGRVKAVERLSATSEAFWRATERHALSRWRFRPATVDGTPVESQKVLNIHFRIEA